MEQNVVECESEKECACKSGATLDILKDVQRAYEDRLQVVERVGGAEKMQMQVRVLRSWVSDLVAQNALLVRAVEELERETTARAEAERRRHAEIECELRAETAVLRRRLARKDSDLRGLVEVLRRLREFDHCSLDGIHFFEVTQSDIFGSDDWEIRRLNNDLQQYEQTMARMRDEMNPNVLKKDAEVMAGMCCTGTECGDLVPVKDIGELLREETSKYRERIQNMEISLKSSSVKLRTVHKVNLGLIEELNSLRPVCIAVEMERRELKLKLDLEGQIVKQMARQLRQVKAKDRIRVATSTPDGTQVLPDEAEISIIPPQPQSAMTISDEDLEDRILLALCKCDANDVHEQTTLKLDTPDITQNILNQSQNLKSGSSHLNESGQLRLDTSYSLLNQNRNTTVESSPRNQSGNLRITSQQSTRNQDTNLVNKRCPKDLSENQSPFCFTRYVIPVARPKEPSENLQPDSNQSPNQVYEQGSRDVSDSLKSASDLSRSRYNIPEKRPMEPSVSLQTDFNQNARNLSTIIINEHRFSDQGGNEMPAMNRSYTKNNITEARSRERSVSLQPDSGQSANNQSTHLIHEHNTRDQSDKQKRVSIQSQFEYNIPEKRPREPSISLQLDSDQSANNQNTNIINEHNSGEEIDNQRTASDQRYPSRYLIHKTSPRDLVIKIDQDPSQNSRNKSLNPLPKNTRAENDSDNPPEQSQSLLNPSLEDLSQPRSKDQSKNDEVLTKRSKIKDGISSEECLCKCLCQNTSFDSTAISDNYKSESDKEKNTSTSKNIKEKSSEECHCKCICQNTSYNLMSVNQTCMSSENLTKESIRKSESHKEKTSSKSENDKEKSKDECECKCICENTISKSESDKEKTSGKAENAREESAEECLCKCTCKETKSDKSTISDNQRWMITPEGLLRGLEALKQSFLGKSEDHTSIWINKVANRTPSYLHENIHTDSTIASPNASSETNHRKKSVTIQEPTRSNKCVYCNPNGICEEDSDVCVNPDTGREIQKPEKSDRSQGSEPMFFVENAELKTRPTSSWEATEDTEGTSETAAGPRRMLRAKLIVKKEPVQDSGGSSCAGACEQYYRDKLLATLQILENKEETIRVQGSSLAVAEDRITELTKRASELRLELEHKARELNQIRQFAESRAEKSDVSISAEMKDAEAQKHLVETLEDNLSTVIELYRECFYETAKQEDLIEMLRKSYLDVRLMEKNKTEKINRLQNVINTQKKSIEQCQDVVLEVESLKSEISSFLNSSNNDSGMWERGSESPDVSEELADILDQLRQLQQMLTNDCTCGLDEECSSLKERNSALEAELEKQTQRNNELDGALRQILDQQYENQMKEKEREFQEVVKKLADVENTCKERGETCETLARQLQQAKVMLVDKTAELMEAQKLKETQDSTIRRLQQDLDKSEQLVEEGLKKLSELAHSRTSLLLESQARVSELEQRLRHSARRCRELEAGCRQHEACLEEAHARGARLCEESRRVTAGVKQWMREKKQLAREQQEKIKMQKSIIRELERCLGARQNSPELTSQSETDPCCSTNTQEYRLTCETSYPRCSRLNPTCRSETTTFLRGPVADRIERERENETASCSKCASNRQESASEMASCSQAPVPPRRKKRQSCDDLNYRQPSQARTFEPSGQPDIRWSRLYSRLRHSSPTDEVLERVEHLHAALAAGQRRWGRARR